jgi:hypothetical protein
MRVDEQLRVVDAQVDAFEVDVDVRRIERLAVKAALLRIRDDLDSGGVWRCRGGRRAAFRCARRACGVVLFLFSFGDARFGWRLGDELVLSLGTPWEAFCRSPSPCLRGAARRG